MLRPFSFGHIGWRAPAAICNAELRDEQISGAPPLILRAENQASVATGSTTARTEIVMTIPVHHLANSRSQRILWLLEKLQLPYVVRRYERDPVTHLAPPALNDIHALGKAPLIQADGVTLAETAVIHDHLVRRAGRLGKPATPEAAARYDFFMH